MSIKELLDKGYGISKGRYKILKYDYQRRYNKGEYSLHRMGMGGWNEVGCKKAWEEFVEYVEFVIGEKFIK
ncbi:MAG: hypothetical protein ACRDDY_03545 [Clostridium sp.]|uniref:hypothetical protein n=1 Tax=Clostridium sp. TaxID=1506 RepID=UPI003EE6C65D